METKIQIVEQDGVKAEVATLVFGGKEFTALGSCVDMERGVVSAYVGASVERDDDGVAHLPGRLFRVTTFSGEKIALARLISKSRRIRTTFGSHVIEYYTMKFAGFYWHGKKGDSCDLIRFRKGKPLVVNVKLPVLEPGDMLGLPKIVGTS
jgi:hypothetical protein